LIVLRINPWEKVVKVAEEDWILRSSKRMVKTKQWQQRRVSLKAFSKMQAGGGRRGGAGRHGVLIGGSYLVLDRFV